MLSASPMASPRWAGSTHSCTSTMPASSTTSHLATTSALCLLFNPPLPSKPRPPITSGTTPAARRASTRLPAGTRWPVWARWTSTSSSKQRWASPVSTASPRLPPRLPSRLPASRLPSRLSGPPQRVLWRSVSSVATASRHPIVWQATSAKCKARTTPNALQTRPPSKWWFN